MVTLYPDGSFAIEGYYDDTYPARRWFVPGEKYMLLDGRNRLKLIDGGFLSIHRPGNASKAALESKYE